MPLFLLPAVATALAGAFIGSQIDDAIESPINHNANENTGISTFDFIKIGTVGAVALIVYGIARKNGLLK